MIFPEGSRLRPRVDFSPKPARSAIGQWDLSLRLSRSAGRAAVDQSLNPRFYREAGSEFNVVALRHVTTDLVGGIINQLPPLNLHRSSGSRSVGNCVARLSFTRTWR